MRRIGIVDPDTSHARHFVEILRKDPEVKVIGFLAKSNLRSGVILDSYAKQFSLNQYATPKELAENVDAVLVLAADWRLHITIAEFLVSKGIVVLIDKPIVGSYSDLEKLEALIGLNADKIFGGSALPYTNEIAHLRAHQSKTEAASINISGPCDSFFTRIHSSEIAASLLSLDGSTRVTANHDGMIIETSSGDRCSIDDDPNVWTVESRTKANREIVEIKSSGIYENYLNCFTQFLEGRYVPDLSEAWNGVRLELARARSERLNRSVLLSELASEDVIEVQPFLSKYKRTHGDEPL